jgi:hypothetical protein
MAYTIPARTTKNGKQIPEIIVDDEFRDLVSGMFVYLQGQKKRPSVKVNGRPVMLHRLLWTLKYGECPSILDHINGDKLDNRLKNLRAATNGLNRRNQHRKQRCRNAHLPMGVKYRPVCFDSRTGKSYPVSKPYMAQSQKDGKRIYLGSFATPEEAHAVHTAMKFMLTLVESALCL